MNSFNKGDDSARFGKKSSQIAGIGASITKPVSEPNNNAIKKSAEIKINASKVSSIPPSDEFRAFWGNNVDASWFEGKRFISPFVISISSLILLIFYLCSRLLFSPGEIQQIFAEPTPAELSTEAQLESLNSSGEEENLLIQSQEQEENKNKNLEKDKEGEEKKTFKSKRRHRH